MLLPDTRADAAAPAAADFDYVIHARRSFLDLSLRELGRSGELLYFLVWRDLKVRYKQALIGAGWAVVKPLLMMLIFVAVFGVFMRVPTGDTPYAVMVYTGLLPWTMVATVISAASASLISNAALLTRIYFPRLLAPLSSSLVALVDLAISLPILLGLLIWFDVPITPRVLLLPVWVMLLFLLALGIGLLTAALHVRYRDVGHLLPIVLQVWMYVSPVIYPLDIVPAKWLPLYSLNPLVGPLQGIRWTLLATPPPTVWMLTWSVGLTLLILAASLAFFQRAEDTFADLV